jgi:hypothetical protein
VLPRSAAAHRPEILEVALACGADASTIVLTYRVGAWGGNGSDPSADPSRENADIRVRVSLDGQPWTEIGGGAFVAPSYAFEGTAVLPLRDRYFVQVRADGDWGNGRAGGSSRRTGALEAPGCEMPAPAGESTPTATPASTPTPTTTPSAPPIQAAGPERTPAPAATIEPTPIAPPSTPSTPTPSAAGPVPTATGTAGPLPTSTPPAGGASNPAPEEPGAPDPGSSDRVPGAPVVLRPPAAGPPPSLPAPLPANSGHGLSATGGGHSTVAGLLVTASVALLLSGRALVKSR